jgi:hypothetical protein
MACFRYTLPMFFIYLTKESLSKLDCCPLAVTEDLEVEDLRDMGLDNGKLGQNTRVIAQKSVIG